MPRGETRFSQLRLSHGRSCPAPGDAQGPGSTTMRELLKSLRINRRRSQLLAGLALLFGVAWVPVPATAANPTCTIRGTAGADTLRGTSHRDVICGLGGNDTIYGRGGNDVLIGGPGNDRLAGGTGNDMVSGGTGQDTVIGGAGDDAVEGGSANDSVSGNAGNDTLHGGGQDDVLRGGDGNDHLHGDAGNDRLYGQAGDDSLDGGSGSDTLDGGLGLNLCVPETDEAELPPSCNDQTPPKLVEFSRTPDSIDTSSGSKTVSFTARVTDDLSGVGGAGVAVTTPNGRRSTSYLMTRVSGTANDGTYALTVRIPQNAPQGSWTLLISIGDRAQNRRGYWPQDLEHAGFPSTFDQVGPGDSIPPKLVGLSLAPESVDASGAAAFITFRARVTDDQSGPSGQMSIEVAGPTGTYLQPAYLHKTSATRTEATYEGTLYVPHYAPQGTWTLSARAYDAIGNQAFYWPQDLQNAGLPSTFSQTGEGDVSSPQLTEFSVTPAKIDTSQHSQTVTFTARVTDNLSGVDFGQAGIAAYNPWSSGPYQRAPSVHRLSGTSRDGIWQGKVTVPQYSSTGTWRLHVEAW